MKKLLVILLLVALVSGASLAAAQSKRLQITVDNAAQLAELMRLGRGSADMVAYSTDGQTVLAGGSVGVWLYPVNGLDTAAEPPLIETSKKVTGMAVAPNGSTVAVNDGSQIGLWDLSTMTLVGTITPARSSQAIAYSPDGSLLAINMGGSGISLWDIAAGAEKLLIAGSIQSDAALVFSPDGSLLAGSTTDSKGHLWRVADGSEAALLEGHTRYVYDFVFSPDGSVLATASYDKSVRVWDVATGSEMAVLVGTEEQPLNEAFSVAVSPDGQTLASGHANGLVVYWDVNALAPAQVFGPGVGNIVDLAFSADGTQVLTTTKQPYNYATVALWDAASGEPIAQSVGHTTYMTAAVFSMDNTRLAITDYEKNVWLWDVAAMQELHQTTPLPNLVHTGMRNDTLLGYAPDGSVLAVGDGFDVVLLDPASGEMLRKLNVCAGSLVSFAFSPDSSLIAEATSTGICVYNVATGESLATFSANDWLNTVAWSPDQTLIAVSSKDYTVRVYGLP